MNNILEEMLEHIYDDLFRGNMMCAHPGCTNKRAYAGINSKTGKSIYRKKCNSHYRQELADKRGFSNYVQYRNSTHPYKKYKKTYCENIDGRLGFTCTSTILISAQLEVDHIDGNPSNNELSNLQTLCNCCHSYKTILNEDYLTPGRKQLGIKY